MVYLYIILIHHLNIISIQNLKDMVKFPTHSPILPCRCSHCWQLHLGFFLTCLCISSQDTVEQLLLNFLEL